MNGSCGHVAELYWLKDDVWSQIPGPRNAPPNTMTQCLACAEKAVGRLLTLRDLSIANYANSVQMPSEMRKEYARATLCGAFEAIGRPLPEGWNAPTMRPYTDAAALGAKLGRQTEDSDAILNQLAIDWEMIFVGSREGMMAASDGPPTMNERLLWEHELDELGRKYAESYDHDDEQTRLAKSRILALLKKGYADRFGDPYPDTPS